MEVQMEWETPVIVELNEAPTSGVEHCYAGSSATRICNGGSNALVACGSGNQG